MIDSKMHINACFSRAKEEEAVFHFVEQNGGFDDILLSGDLGEVFDDSFELTNLNFKNKEKLSRLSFYKCFFELKKHGKNKKTTFLHFPVKISKLNDQKIVISKPSGVYVGIKRKTIRVDLNSSYIQDFSLWNKDDFKIVKNGRGCSFSPPFLTKYHLSVKTFRFLDISAGGFGVKLNPQFIKKMNIDWKVGSEFFVLLKLVNTCKNKIDLITNVSVTYIGDNSAPVIVPRDIKMGFKFNQVVSINNFQDLEYSNVEDNNIPDLDEWVKEEYFSQVC